MTNWTKPKATLNETETKINYYTRTRSKQQWKSTIIDANKMNSEVTVNKPNKQVTNVPNEVRAWDVKAGERLRILAQARTHNSGKNREATGI